MSAALAARTGFKFMISIRQGPDQGASYQLLPPKVTIGRSPNNNVVLSDPKVSRAAALIEFTMDQIIITDLSSRNTMFVNGELSPASSIKDGDSIQIGESEFEFKVEAMIIAPPSNQAARLSSMQPPGSFTTTRGMSSQQFQQMSTPPPVQAGGSKLMFYVIVAAVLGVGGWLATSKPKIDNGGMVLRTNAAVEKDIKASEDHTEEIIKKRSFKSDEEKTRFEEGQKHYLEGFRDYQKGQWIRAMRSFETALAIDPDNALARRYYKLAEKQRDETIADLSSEGRKYRDKHMYSRCTSAFEKALELLPNKDDTKYKEADTMRKECQLLEDERFQ